MVASPTITRYIIHGLCIEVSWASPVLAGQGEATLYHHGLEPDAPSTTAVDWHFEISDLASTKAPVLPADAEEVGRHVSELQILRKADDLYLKYRDTIVHIEPAARRVTAVLSEAAECSPPGPPANTFLPLTFTLLLILYEHELYAVHAAALSSGPSSGGVLLIAEQDNGKSTMATNLLRQGWHFVTDDSVLLEAQPDGITALPLRRDFALDPEAAEFFPEIRAHSRPLFTNPQKWRVDMDAMYPNRRLERCSPQVLIFPELRQQSETTIEPIGQTDALLRLMQQSSFLAPSPASASQHMNVLNRLLRQTQCYCLQAGSDLVESPGLTAQLLAPLVD